MSDRTSRLHSASLTLDHANRVRDEAWHHRDLEGVERCVAELVGRALLLSSLPVDTESPEEAWERICAEHPDADEHAVWKRCTPEPLRCPPIEEVYAASGWTP